MQHQEPQFLEVGESRRRRIAFRFTDAGGSDRPALLWVPGFLADMAGLKVLALADWAHAHGISMLRFDYSGHGRSDGNLLEASIGDWLEETATVFQLLEDRRTVVVGSSMGGWIALLLARLVLIAPAWDMTERLMWHRMTPEVKEILERDGVYYEPSAYGERYPISKHLIEEGRSPL